MAAYENALAVITAEHGIVDVVYSYIDRMNDPTEEDPLDKVTSEFIHDVRHAINKHLVAIGRM